MAVRIAMTGVGMVTPLGLTAETSWQGLYSGRRAAAWLESEAPRLPRSCGAKVPVEFETSERLVPFARRAATEAITQSGISKSALRSAACVFGTSKIDMPYFDQFVRSPEAASSVSFFDVVSPSSAARSIASDWGCEGGVICPVLACATGLASLIRGAGLIQEGTCPTVIAGSSDAALHSGLLASYRRLGVHARTGDDPATACRPFDRTRSGFVVGEGAACLVLEEWDQAQTRGAPILAEWIGGAVASDPSGLTSVNPDGAALVEIVRRLLKVHQLTPDDISCISLHGTATRQNDAAEVAALQSLFGHRVERPFAFGLKGAIGHLMGAAGSVEAAASVMSLKHQMLLPTCNHSEADERLPVILSPQGMPAPIDIILKVSLGFGGHVAAALLRRA